MHSLVDTKSRQGGPHQPVVVGGKLHDSALGAIHFARFKTSAPDQPEALVLKTIGLREQNVWAVTQHNQRTTLRGLDDKSVLMMSTQRSEAREWAEAYTGKWAGRAHTVIAKVAYLQSKLAEPRDGALQVLRCNEYLNESLVGHIVTKTLGPHVPHFIGTRDFWISNQGTGFLLQDYGGSSMYKTMADLSLPEFKSILVQTLVALAIGQEAVHLKHHDVHLDNVFVNRLKQTDALLARPAWAYTLQGRSGPVTIQLQHHGVLAKLGDFGLASATDPESRTRIERVDYPILDGTEVEWGEWSSGLEGRESYDAAVLLCKFCLDDESSRATVKQREWARGAYAAVQAATGIECSVIGRPYRGREGRMRIADILALPYFQDCVGGSIEATCLWPTS